MAETEDNAKKQFKCGQCGANMEFAPGAASLKCEYCSFENIIPQSEEDIKELDFHAFLAEADNSEDMVEGQVVKCNSCAAQTTLDPNIVSDACAFCGSDLITSGGSHKEIKPKSLLPFKITEKEAKKSFSDWIKGLWFAPNKLKKYAELQTGINGIYVPYWTYDSNTTSFYTGQRGDDYYVTETYTEDGKTKTRQVKKTRWTSVSGTVWNDFDDVLVLASKSLPTKYAEKLEPWDLNNLEPYRDEFISGFRAECYQVDLEEGFYKAKDIMDSAIDRSIRRDIGGDHQRIHSTNTQYDNITFKHILLPIWISAYMYSSKTYRFLVNARTGEVQGERPWSWVKITLAIAAVVAVIVAILIATHS